MTATHTAKCLRCGRTLTAATSVAAGYGPTCTRRIRDAHTQILAQYKPHQITKARELIEAGAVVPLFGEIYTVVGSSGDLYQTARQTCTCPAGVNGTHTCYHRIAVEIIGLAA